MNTRYVVLEFKDAKEKNDYKETLISPSLPPSGDFLISESVISCVSKLMQNGEVKKNVILMEIAEDTPKEVLPPTIGKKEVKSVCLMDTDVAIKKCLTNAYIQKVAPIIKLVKERIPDAILCGGIAHIINGLKPIKNYQTYHDIDFTVHRYISPSDIKKMIPELFAKANIVSVKTDYENGDHVTMITNNNINIDFFVNPFEKYDNVNVDNVGDLKIAKPWTAIKEKVKYIENRPGSSSSKKHIEDLKNIFLHLSNKK